MSSIPEDILITIHYSETDVLDAADVLDVEPAVALERAREWARHVEATASTLVNEQMWNVVMSNQP